MLQQAFATPMKNILILCVIMALGGCVSLSRPGGVLYPSTQSNRLAQAVALLEQGRTDAARELLAALCAEPGVAGITDEALLRLSLLRLGAGQDRQIRHDLERLKKEYPASSWSPLADLLNEQLLSSEELQQQNRKLKEQNSSSTRENRELRQSIEKLKSLELELGKKIRR